MHFQVKTELKHIAVSVKQLGMVSASVVGKYFISCETTDLKGYKTLDQLYSLSRLLEGQQGLTLWTCDCICSGWSGNAG